MMQQKLEGISFRGVLCKLAIVSGIFTIISMSFDGQPKMNNDTAKESNGHIDDDDEGQSKKVFVGNLTDECTQTQLLHLFEAHGKVRECSIIRDYAFVHFTEAEHATAAVESLNGKFLNGRPLSVQLSMSRLKKRRSGPTQSWSGVACFNCGGIGHRAAKCTSEPRSDRGGRGGASRGYRSRSPRRFSRDHWGEEAHGRGGDPYERGPYAPRSGPYREPYDYYGEGYGRDGYSRDPYGPPRDAYPPRRGGGGGPMRGGYGRPSLYRDPADRYRYMEEYKGYGGGGGGGRPDRRVASDPYGRPPPDYYTRRRP